MAQYSIRSSRIIDAPIEIVWDLVADARAYRSWTLMSTTELEREGTDQPDGVGAIRRLGTGPIVSREEIVGFEPPHHLAYVLLSGLPLDDYRADVRLTALGERRTRLTWEGTFSASPPKGRVMVPFLRFVLGDFVRRVARHAPQRVV